MINFIIKKVFHPIYKKQVAKQIVSLCKNNQKILDFGCGDGVISKEIMKLNETLTIVGVDLENRSCKIPITIASINKIPFPDKYFDTTIVVDVLHHNKSILKTLQEIKRVTKKYIIIKDHTANNCIEKIIVYLADYITNALYKIKCYCNYPSLILWQDFFNILNLKVIEKKLNLKFGVDFTGKFNPIFKLEIKE